MSTSDLKRTVNRHVLRQSKGSVAQLIPRISTIYTWDRPVPTKGMACRCHYYAFVPFSTFSTTGMATGPPGEFGNLAVRTSTPSAVTKSVCSMRKSANSTNIRSAKPTKLRRSLPVLRRAGPVVWPGHVLVRSQIDHRLDRKAHALLRLPNRLVVLVMRDVWRAMEQAVDAVAYVRLDDVALL